MVSEKLTLTVEEMAKELGISRPHAFEQVRQGIIPARKLGRRWIISRKSLEDWLSQPTNTKKATEKQVVVANGG